jgi:hypothetical protein
MDLGEETATSRLADWAGGLAVDIWLFAGLDLVCMGWLIAGLDGPATGKGRLSQGKSAWKSTRVLYLTILLDSCR